ncbi:MAG: imidazole glycerol phosphate synthase subunit HisH [Bacteroidales bacterium]|nr:imidazole glycerol phosphate synthase subunit HisH [Bacteroidales bacterium]
MIAIIDYRMGNLRSVKNALQRLGTEYIVTSSPSEIMKADKVLLPGVGNAEMAMENLRNAGLCDVIRELRQPVLGICVGLQVMCRHSQEGDTECLGIFDSKVMRFTPSDGLKVPHMGWNRISNLEGKLFKGIPSGEYVYYVHSYYPQLCCDTIATTTYGGMFSAALKYENFYGTQFHPEKSGDTGELIIKNFLEL